MIPHHSHITDNLDCTEILSNPDTHIVLCCGSGGVGKTTTAAALGLRAAKYGRKTVVLTIDPARRLAQALGFNTLGNTPQPVQLPKNFPGTLDAMMLDMRRTFDEIIIQYSTPERAEALMADPFYQTVANSLSGTQEYMAMEKLGQLLEQNRWDLIIVDTPPSRNALDFLDTPKRLDSFMNSRLWKILLGPGRGLGRFMAGILGLAMRTLSNILGSQLLADAAAFVQALDTTFHGFQARAHNTYQLLSQPGTHFMVVSSPEPEPLTEASYFIQRLTHDHMPLSGVILNRTHPQRCHLSSTTARKAAHALENSINSHDQITAQVLNIHADYAEVIQRELTMLDQFIVDNPHTPIALIPVMNFEIDNLDMLDRIGDHLTNTSTI